MSHQMWNKILQVKGFCMNEKNEPLARSAQNISTILKSMVAECGGKRSVASQIREAFDQIESAQQNGFSLRVICTELKCHELNIEEPYLKNVLKRIRAERREHGKHGSQKNQAPSLQLSKTYMAAVTDSFTRNTDRDLTELF